LTTHRRFLRFALGAVALAVVSVAAPAAADRERPARAAASITDWKMSKKGLGQLRVGRTVAEVEAISGYQMKPSYGSRSCKIWTLSGAPEGISIMTANGKVVRVDVFRRPWETLLGIHVGMKGSVVRRRHPGLRVKPHPYTPGGHYLIVGGRPRRMIFETGRRGRITSFRGGLTKPVGYIEGCA
jgi:hypothetical protein